MASRKQPRKDRPALQRVPEEVREWSALLKSELDSWPGISYRKMFGVLAVYRKGVIFAGLPDKRALFTGRSVIFKFPTLNAKLAMKLNSDERVLAGTQPGKGWFGFELRSAGDITPALAWISLAYEAAKPTRKKG
ncbi:MAG: hypothetical protein HYX26_02370 [Acidobacteriales bacterium]|nr:hypothetical protein [Terriglobales bacterium]